ncbi:hypothetical protein DM02DRAFT_668616 [Periconia macrospinosa]|uniref:Uncharacterized protein n=1 Tax=Periconia macrospinosa TaxID=97972 RepID=A0A2V1E7F5_9PLEO|nr:hypothetical protein DM02DRAFT_668616 [Periconia macrospinosa]
MPTKRKASDSHSPASSGSSPLPQHSTKRVKGEPASTLIPIEARQTAKQGEKNVSLLRMTCVDQKSGEKKELHFKKLIHSEIDWNNNEHICKINSWRNQLYGRAGMKSKQITMWNEVEVSFLELTFHLLIVEGAKFGVMVPRTRAILDAFNDHFTGMVFQDSHGRDYEPREARPANAFTSKLTRVAGNLKDRLEAVIEDRPGDSFLPVITQAMIKQYLELKADSPVNGDSKNLDKVFTWKAGTPVPTGDPYIGKWQAALENMLQQDSGSKMAESEPVRSIECDAADLPEDIALQVEAATILVQMRAGTIPSYDYRYRDGLSTLSSSPY